MWESPIVFVNLHDYMPMKRVFAILIASFVLLAGCSEEDTMLPNQRDKIVSYLTSSHVPKLISEAEVADQGELPYYSISGATVYRYIDGIYNPQRPTLPEVVRGSTVTITFRAYVFNYQNITDTTMPFYSNDKLLEQAFYEAGLTPGAWPFEPFVIELGRTQILKGLESALIGCREGDQVEAYMTSNMAYGDDKFSIIPLNSPIAYFFTVDKVE